MWLYCVSWIGILIFVNTNLIHLNAKCIQVHLSTPRQEFSPVIIFQTFLGLDSSSRTKNEPDLLRNRWNISHYVTGTIFIEHKKCTSNDFGHLSWLLSFLVQFLDVGCFYLFLSILLFQWMFSWCGAEPHDSNLCLVKSDFLSHLPGLFHSVCNPSGWLCGDGMVCPL